MDPDLSPHPTRSQLVFIMVTMFLNFLGFSVIIPILPFLISKYTTGTDSTALYMGLLLSVYALCQFISAPGLGTLSDRFGRRPILLISLLGSVVGYLFLGLGHTLGLYFVGRIIDGLTGGNISSVYAYMADITAPRTRGHYFGLLGAAGGFGFMLGPALGGVLGHLSLTLPLFVAAGVTLLNVFWGYFILPESLHPRHRIAKVHLPHLNPFTQFGHLFGFPKLVRLFLIGFIFFLALNTMYANNAVFLKDIFGWSLKEIGLALFGVGLLDIITQGYLVRILLPKIGGVKLTYWGILLAVIGFSLAFAGFFVRSNLVFYLGLIVLNVGDGFYEPAAAGMISVSVDHQSQGRIQGAFQGLQSIARILGPLLAAFAYNLWHGLPYLTEAVLVLVSFLILRSSLPLFGSDNSSQSNP